MSAEKLKYHFMKKLILPIMVLCATMSMAQNDPLDSKKDTVSLEEVVITANRIKEKKTDAVANVTIIDQKKLQQFIKIAPDVGFSIPMRSRASVLFPEPLSP